MIFNKAIKTAMTFFDPIRAPLALLMLALLAVSGPAQAQPRRFSPEDLRADLRFMAEAIARTHPDLGHSVDRRAYARALHEVGRRLNRPMTRDEAWGELARLNPVFADGHLLVGFPDWRGESAERIAAGDTPLFPFEVALDARGDLRIVAPLGGGSTPYAGARIERINGADARAVTRGLLARAHGDTPAFRRALLSRRWWLFYWKLHGAPRAYSLVLGGHREVVRVPASRAQPAVLRDDASFERQVHFAELPGGRAVLTLGAFDRDKAQFLAFAREAFQRVRAAGIRTLIIDVRMNGGGSDDLWIEGVMPYIADRPFRWGSRYRKRVLEGRAGEGETVGQVIDGEVDTLIQPQPDNPLRFDGEVYVLVGPSTYSSAVLFANTVQDYGFGQLAGVGGVQRTRQSGGTQRIVLPNTGLVLSCPRFLIERPSGARTPEFLRPDLPLADDPLRPDAMIEALSS